MDLLQKRARLPRGGVGLPPRGEGGPPQGLPRGGVGLPPQGEGGPPQGLPRGRAGLPHEQSEHSSRTKVMEATKTFEDHHRKVRSSRRLRNAFQVQVWG